MAAYDNKVLTGDQLVYYSGLVKTALAAKADASALANKQNTLVISQSYDGSNNPIATMDDILEGVGDWMDNSGVYTDMVLTGELDENDEPITLDTVLSNMDAAISDAASGVDWTNIPIGNTLTWETVPEDPEDPESDTYTYLEVVPTNLVIGYGEEDDGEGGTIPVPISLDSKFGDIDDAIATKQDALVFNTAYNAVNNKVATMSDITTALGGISSFSFEIVQSLPQSNISTSKIYLVAKATSGTNQVYTEYAYVNNAWEIIGDTQMTIDTLSNAEVSTIWSTATATV